MELTWFGVRSVFEILDFAKARDRTYEERVVLILAGSQDEALEKAEEEAHAYASETTRYLGYAMAFEMFDSPGEGVEVFSLMRDSRLDPKEYLDALFDTGRERSTRASSKG